MGLTELQELVERGAAAIRAATGLTYFQPDVTVRSFSVLIPAHPTSFLPISRDSSKTLF